MAIRGGIGLLVGPGTSSLRSETLSLEIKPPFSQLRHPKERLHQGETNVCMCL